MTNNKIISIVQGIFAFIILFSLFIVVSNDDIITSEMQFLSDIDTAINALITIVVLGFTIIFLEMKKD